MRSWPTRRSRCSCRHAKGLKSRFLRLCTRASQSLPPALAAFRCRFNTASRAISARLGITTESRATYTTFTRMTNSTKQRQVLRVQTSRMRSAPSVMPQRGCIWRSCIPVARRSNRMGNGSMICCAKRLVNRTRRASRGYRVVGCPWWVE